MTEEEKKLVMDLMLGTISKDKFIKVYPVNILENNEHIKELLTNAFDNKDADDVEYALLLGFSFGFSEKYVDVLNNLISVDWHYKHEDVARVLQELKDPRSINCLYETALAEFDYLDYDDSYALGVKCIWALGDINTKNSKEKLEELSHSDNKILKAAAEHQLERIATIG